MALVMVAAAAIALLRGAGPQRAAAEFDRAGLPRFGAMSITVDAAGAGGALQAGRRLQAALDTAPAGGRIVLAPGTYRGRFHLGDRPLELIGSAGAEHTRLESDGAPGPVLTIQGAGADTRLQGITFSGGRGPDGAGLHLLGADPAVVSCIFRANEGGGAVLDRSGASFEACRFLSNVGATMGAGLRAVDSTPILVECEFDSNQARSGGGGIYAIGGETVLIRSTVARNTALQGAWGGGIFADSGKLRLMDSEVRFNTSHAQGAGVYMNGGSARIERCDFLGNLSESAWSLFTRDGTVDLVASRLCGDRERNLAGDTVRERDVQFLQTCWSDCNRNGIPDEQEIASGLATDCDGSGMPDACKLDCNENGIPDVCEIARGLARDCNANGIIDSCEIAWGLAEDANHNFQIDECEQAAAAAAAAGR